MTVFCSIVSSFSIQNAYSFHKQSELLKFELIMQITHLWNLLWKSTKNAAVFEVLTKEIRTEIVEGSDWFARELNSIVK